MTKYEFQVAVEDILGVANGTLDDSASRDTIESWSSLADARIVVFVASELGVEPDAEMMEAETLGDLIRVLDDKSAFSD